MNDFAENIEALKRRDPILAGLIASLHPDPERYAMLPTQQGRFSLEITDASGKRTSWHSRYDPIKEAEREISSIEHDGIYVPIFIGLGLGYTLRLLWDCHRPEFFNAILLERDPYIFRLAMEVTPLSDILADTRISLLVGEDLCGWQEIIQSALPGIMSSRVQLIRHAASQQIHRDYYQFALQMLSSRIRIARAEFDLMIRSGARIQENLWRNFPTILNSAALLDIRHSLQGKPAIVVAAGPSLDKNVHLLNPVQNACTIIAVDTALHTLHRHGISPHFAVTTDPTELNRKHFDDLSPSPQTILAFDPEVFAEIPEKWPHRKLFMNLEKAEFTRWIENTFGPYGFIPKGGSVGHTAFFLACELGADPIILVGLDLAFDPAGGATHASGSLLKREHGRFIPGSNQATLGPRFNSNAIQEDIVWVPGTVYPQVPTSQVMAIYIQQFRDLFAAVSARIIDATEGGARLDGTEIMRLEDALRKYLPADSSNSLPFESLPPKPVDRQKVREEIQRILQQLQASAPIAQQGLHHALNLQSRVNLGKMLRETPEWLEMESCFNTLYQSTELKIALEQTLFSAVYQFIQKEHQDQIELRLRKYQIFFEEYLHHQPYFLAIVQAILQEFSLVSEP